VTEKEYRRAYYEVYNLPAQIERARLRLRHLEARASHYRLYDLLHDPAMAGDAFELEATRALAANRECER